ncbi:hypothetical protein PCC7424_3147 [Gloeothece citriformis PCC 7424]|uniref:Uncharacterized protein n=1 Tax=Gloeothece citriformis (strain PCC 7424) TaxID=65393 RepID=B7KCJ8_GLOC7|nr:hypothetical protein [Gloeothece citriformis]ACK71549.1 hypothetical protein PCC7424_3147 [Gloeothece citriformis PCC 7424]
MQQDKAIFQLFEEVEKQLVKGKLSTNHLSMFSKQGLMQKTLEYRIEAAMPSQTEIKQTTEVRLIAASLNSSGLQNYLPDSTELDDLITKKDIRKNQFPIEFFINQTTDELLPTNLFISLIAPDFLIDKPLKTLYLSPNQDSGVLTFLLIPQTPKKLARVIVELYKDQEKSILLSSLTLITKIKRKSGLRSYTQRFLSKFFRVNQLN